MVVHSGAYVFAHFGSRMQSCAHVGVRFKLTIALAPISARLNEETEIGDANTAKRAV